MANYEEIANEFAGKYNVKLEVLSSTWGKYFPEDKKGRSIFTLRLSRNEKTYTFKFGQSIASGCEHPTMYDVLACLTKYDVGSLDDFANEFGYDLVGREWTVTRTYKAVVKEYNAVIRLFGDVIEELEEIN